MSLGLSSFQTLQKVHCQEHPLPAQAPNPHRSPSHRLPLPLRSFLPPPPHQHLRLLLSKHHPRLGRPSLCGPTSTTPVNSRVTHMAPVCPLPNISKVELCDQPLPISLTSQCVLSPPPRSPSLQPPRGSPWPGLQVARAECRQPVSGWECGVAGVLGEMDEEGRTRDSERQSQSQTETEMHRERRRERDREKSRDRMDRQKWAEP